ncbi:MULTISPECIES: DUF2169 family type VI secretion system accessory protein [Photorhabdus]|uniref:DUF2169 domain-containing protein n=2 Tax=Photorhabdus asymbiotica TaxID=291112 RepID=B6VLB8_PHOAA|nr:DUF2169 domain-containing protein [Photorhabdus asymbiotica]RKS59748.1 pentapeptide repeat protein [Photorhabdus asymbiotica]CAQ85892.1 conserved hypothetical Protein [Photorhabdus asymbiotica]CAR66948.1 Hypothetical Protein PA-RVA7-0650 [Photorhabdus asymbiotica subsp. asymbiotica ATCC 43949]
MKIIKPLRLGLLHRPWRWQQQNYLGVTVMALTDMSDSPQIRPEPELWQLVAQELQSTGGVLDLSIPKPCAEFFASGYAWTNHQSQKEACIAKIQVADKEKSLMVFGDRYWQNGHPSTPQPFEKMHLDWTNAFGGNCTAENPLGKGDEPVTRDGVLWHPLPNVELPEQLLHSVHQRVPPASFAPLDFSWPQRSRLMGKKYDKQWLAHEFPGFARDTDWHLFNMAGQDQWLTGQSCLPPAASWRIWNMHPTQAVQQGTLPCWQARCFINRQRGEEMRLEEIHLRATTVWFMPHLERMVLIWHGACPINEDDAVDVHQMLVAMELAQSERPVAHYQQVMAQRAEKEKGALFTLREKDLIDESLIAPWIDNDVQVTPSALAEMMTRRETYLRQRHQARNQKQDQDINQLLTELPQQEEKALTADKLPELVASLERQAERIQQRAQKKNAVYAATKQVGAPPSGPASYYRMMDLLHKQSQKTPAFQTPEALKQTHRSLHQMYLLSADTRPPAARLQGEQAEVLRRHVMACMATKRDLSGMDLTGADLSGLDLRRANLQRTLLENANLDNCCLDEADLSEAMLAYASLNNTSLNAACLDNVSLTGARCHNCYFTGARLGGVLLEQAELVMCDFTQASLSDILLRQCMLYHCHFSQARLENCLFMELMPEELDFSYAHLTRMTVINGGFIAVRFNHAVMDSCTFLDSALDHAQYQHAHLESCVFTGKTHIRSGLFQHARLTSCNFRLTLLEAADFSEAVLQNCDFSEADLSFAQMRAVNGSNSLFIRTLLTNSNLQEANLMGAILQKSHLAGADLRRANLFRADISQSSVDVNTQLQGALLDQCKTLPCAGGDLV